MNIDAGLAILVLFAAGIIFLGPWQEVCTAYARQVAFEKRDAIFDMAASGELDFSSPEYQAIRRSIEQLIRFAHELTFAQLLVMTWHLRRAKKIKQESNLKASINAIKDRAAREKVSGLVSEVHAAMLIMMLAKSPIAAAIGLVGALLSNRKDNASSRIRQVTKPVGEMIQVEAECAPFNSDTYYPRAA
ncbi:hypothetical protein [Sinorhizobium meliloti]|uniref:hypothetical protein n=1 Tax=Rhizobium meliloti TaxID=382 RepID=UPI0012974DA3|nr:hypothetical protein [Sinorhizobium meliloti]MDE3854815.1 hypothetical protein [Sinorhizobium meliloti]MQW52492.1 hypothetical protein [Sinorhizobium meliloti]